MPNQENEQVFRLMMNALKDTGLSWDEIYETVNWWNWAREEVHDGLVATPLPTVQQKLDLYRGRSLLHRLQGGAYPQTCPQEGGTSQTPFVEPWARQDSNLRPGDYESLALTN